MLFAKLSVDGLGYLVLFLFGAGLLFWGLWQVRSGLKAFDQIQREIGEQADELRSEIASVKRDLQQIIDQTDSDKEPDSNEQ